MSDQLRERQLVDLACFHPHIFIPILVTDGNNWSALALNIRVVKAVARDERAPSYSVCSVISLHVIALNNSFLSQCDQRINQRRPSRRQITSHDRYNTEQQYHT